mmetsp:Transcript_41302/g.66558  ORF Transcript_41302/g.66558 Transcript_41302/m.66558 type:complete len:205 (+) Transcript_41302:49-663(+)|eukprot:CAMPEP_0179438354 /NCGR_PEP_ID=MMETSP0799-20121207/22105_1 /TAXON_ID=46947 /ORGANISM="Geminigera cryophila, Strain CCMP2564" /LENGTH=204 /DNA_ID=CAMNT_0021219923 /DNA_START=89 /DNA_END=703 /DNA_ORIENTATION=-
MDLSGMPQDAAEMRNFANMLEEQIVSTRVAVDANPNDYMALAKWGELLLELAMLKQGEEATAILLQSIAKLKRSLELYGDNSHAMVVLASALNARAFLQQDPDVAAQLFESSKKNFERALELDPSNSRCRQLLEAMENAPALHAQVVQQLQMQAMMGQQSGYPGAMGGKAASDDEWIYDALGWSILVTGAVGLLVYMNVSAPRE